ncbi:MAG: HAD-IB family phosphatase [Legionella sp.]|jgi:phosphoserine phosphatase
MRDNDTWVLKEPIEYFFFDCDSTLSLMEGIDVLATMNQVEAKVHAITERCMSKTGLTVHDYKQRLNYVKPTRDQIKQLAQLYEVYCAPGARETIQVLHDLGKKVFIISGGIKESIIPFAQKLGITADRVLAVDVYFDEKGAYQGFDEQSNLVQANGKALEIAAHHNYQEHSLLVGDGISDWEARKTVTRFVGYAGLQAKEFVQNHSQFYITNANLYPILPLGLTDEESTQLVGEHFAYYLDGLSEIQNDLVLIREPEDV